MHDYGEYDPLSGIFEKTPTKLQGPDLLDKKLRESLGIHLYNEDGTIKNFCILMDDLLLCCDMREFQDIMDFIVENQDDIFGGFTDERRP